MTRSTIRLAFWNTWLLRPVLWPGGPRVPIGEDKLAPDVDRRSPLVGSAIADRFDVVALGECFEAREQQAVAATWPEATVVPGPTRKGPRLTGSGLMTLVAPTVGVAHQTRHRFRSGGDWRDSDTFATKGALLTRVCTAEGLEIDVVSTHLVAGGDLFPIPGHDDTVRHHAARMRQTDELVAFVERERCPDVAVVMLGDFNVCAYDHEPSLGDPTERYRDLAGRIEPLGLSDVWAEHGIGPGHTCTFDGPADLPAEPAEPDMVRDEPGDDPATAPGERIDYLWAGSSSDGTVRIDTERPRRWAFTGRDARGGPAGSLSDHLALSVTVQLSTD